jgi:hypothetical protein
MFAESSAHSLSSIIRYPLNNAILSAARCVRGSTTHILARGPAPQLRSCAPPLHPPGLWLLLGIEPIPEPSDRIADQPLARRLRSPCTHRPRGYRAPWNHSQRLADCTTNQGSVPAAPDTPMTISWRPTFRSLDARHWKGAFHSCPCLGTIPSSRSLSPLASLISAGAALDAHQVGLRKPSVIGVSYPRSIKIAIGTLSKRFSIPVVTSILYIVMVNSAKRAE